MDEAVNISQSTGTSLSPVLPGVGRPIWPVHLGWKPAGLSLIHIYSTTNTIRGFNRQLRKVTKSKTVFSSDDSLIKMLYLAMMDITKKWAGHRQDLGRFIPNWRLILRNGYPDYMRKRAAGAVFLDMPKTAL